jgi:hypothetical protein
MGEHVTVVAGWYTDPQDPGRFRWWDGVTWTAHVQANVTSHIPAPLAVSAPVSHADPIETAAVAHLHETIEGLRAEEAALRVQLLETRNLFLLQEYLPHDPEHGIVRLEFLGGELLYAMRVITHGRFNLCPSPVCNPDDGDGVCAVPEAVADAPPVEFVPYPDVPADAVETATRIVRAAKLDVGGIEYLETPTGRRVFYDINANSNLRPSVAAAFGFDPFERVVDFLVRELAR